MGSKAILFLCLFALVMMIASEVTAMDLAAKDAVETNGGHSGDRHGDWGGGGGGGGYGGGHGGGYGGGRGGGGGGWRGGGCRQRCCGKWGCRCCSYAGEAADVEPEAKPHN